MINQEHYYIVTQSDIDGTVTTIKHPSTGMWFSEAGRATPEMKKRLMDALEDGLKTRELFIQTPYDGTVINKGTI